MKLLTCVGGTSQGSVCANDAACPESVCQNQFAYDDDAINFYIVSTCDGGWSSTRDVGANIPIVIMGQVMRGSRVRLFHEAGHALGMCHTHGCPDGVNGVRDQTCSDNKSTGAAPTCTTDPLDDVSSDTACDCPSWDDEKLLAQGAFQDTYENLSSPQKGTVLDTLLNVMSYHQDNDSSFPTSTLCTTEQLDQIVPGCIVNSATAYDILCPDPDNPTTMVSVGMPCRHRLTDDQLDRATDRSNCSYPNMVSGRTWFVGNNPGPNPIECASVPIQVSVADGTAAASNGEVLMLWPGTYSSQLDFTQPITLRASRGTATIRP